MAEEKKGSSQEKKESSGAFARHNEWESALVVFLFPVLIFGALFDNAFE